MDIQMTLSKRKRRVNLKIGRESAKAFIDMYTDLPWPEFVIHENKVYKYDRVVRGGTGYWGGTGEYTIDYGFYNTLQE